MQIFFKNETDKTVILHIAGNKHTLMPYAGRYIKLCENTTEFSVCTDLKYRCEPITGKLGLSYFHRFIVTSRYTVTATDNCTVRFYSETAHGNNFESYTRVYPFSIDCEISSPFYSVNDEEKIKAIITRSDKNEAVILQSAGVAGKLIKAKNTFDDIITVSILAVVALIAFILIWIFKNFRTAALIYISVAAFGFLTWKLFFEKALRGAKSKAKQKAEKKIEKMFLTCENLPEGIFKDKSSYFSNDYISAVFEHSKKRI